MKKTKQQLIEEIRANLGKPVKVDNFEEAEDFIENSPDKEFIVIVTKKTVDKLNLGDNMELEIN